jgi:two-component system cell cycle response regulator DivK
MDIQLPGIDGLQATRQLRANPATQDIPIVALTALAMVGDEERALASGCNAYLTKPVSPHDLQDMTRRYLLEAAA